MSSPVPAYETAREAAELLRRMGDVPHLEHEAKALSEFADAVDAVLDDSERLREALTGLDGPIAWIAENYPAAMDAMPSHFFDRIKKAGEALKSLEGGNG